MSAPSQAGGVRIERARLAQAAAIARLHAQLFDPPWHEASIRQLMEDRSTLAFVAVAADAAEPLAILIGRVIADEAELLTIAVDRAWQRRGIARRLLEAMCQAAREAGARSLYLEVASGNAAAQRLYEQIGAREIGRRKAYYEHAGAPAEDAINLAIPL